MSKWSSLRVDCDTFGEGSETGKALASCGYVVHIPPPLSGPSLPSSAVDIVSITIPHLTTSPDMTCKQVTWYEVFVRTASHQWSVLKRFSEFRDFCVSIEKTGLMRLAGQLNKSFKGLPSRFSFFLQQRQSQLQLFLESLLQTLKDLSVIVMTNGNGDSTGGVDLSLKKMTGVTRAAFANFIHFLTTSSYDVSMQDGNNETSSSSVFLRASASQQLVMNEQSHVPPSKIVHIPGRLFIIMLQLPGTSMSAVFVESTPASGNPREIVVCGSWDSDITAFPSLIKEALDSARSELLTCRSLTDRYSNVDNSIILDSSTVLVDTFPAGDFQMRFEVPLPFLVEGWKSDYVDGVLFLSWRHSTEASS